MTQQYSFLGTFESQDTEAQLLEHLQAQGWGVQSLGCEEWLICKAPLTAYIEQGQPWLINGHFKGTPADMDLLLTDFAHLQIHFAIDLFGDAARLVRRCHSGTP